MIGTLLQKALTAVGVTEERVSAWLGRPCGCARRAAKLDQLEAAARQWAKEDLLGRGGRMRRHFDAMLGPDGEEA